MAIFWTFQLPSGTLGFNGQWEHWFSTLTCPIRARTLKSFVQRLLKHQLSILRWVRFMNIGFESYFSQALRLFGICTFNLKFASAACIRCGSHACNVLQ